MWKAWGNYFDCFSYLRKIRTTPLEIKDEGEDVGVL